MILKTLKIVGLILVFGLVAGVSAYFTVSLLVKSEDTVVVPELVGKDVVSTLELLTDMGLNTKVSGSEYSESVPKNHIIYQEPKAGVEIKIGRDIKIVLSKGSQAILMPNLVSLPERQAELILEENGLCRGKTAQTHHAMGEPGTIVAHFPLPGTVIFRKSCVDLLVSRGPMPTAIKMPDLTGLSFDEAVLRIERSGLVVGDVEPRFAANEPLQTVLEQQPPDGYRVAVGSSVAIFVNRPPVDDSAATRMGIRTSGVFRHWVDSGFLRKRIRVRYKSESVERDLFDDYVKPGREIVLMVPDDSGGLVFLYEDEQLQPPMGPLMAPGWSEQWVFRSAPPDEVDR